MQRRQERPEEPAERPMPRVLRLTRLCQAGLSAFFRKEDLTMKDWRRIEFRKHQSSEHGGFGGSL